MKVLIVEDHADLAEVLAMFLVLAGHEVRIELNVDDGIAAAQTIVPDTIICDINLHNKNDGFRLATKIRNNSLFKDTILISMSGFTSEDILFASIKSGFDQHITKPINGQELVNILNKIQRQSQT